MFTKYRWRSLSCGESILLATVTTISRFGTLFIVSALVVSNPLFTSPASANSPVTFSENNSNLAKDTIALTSQSIPSAQSKTKSFAQWCQEKDTLPVATVRTIDILLKQAKTQNCKSADSILGKLTELNIREGKISDLRPIAGFKNLTSLNLDDNQIVDLAPLSNLTKLTTLSLSINKIVNVSPLANLSNLKNLSLLGNQISDVKSLAKLKKLTWLQLSENPISYGAISKRVCPIKPASNCVWIYE
jgi:Leucine-rich repeat (LRR) protein